MALLAGPTGTLTLNRFLSLCKGKCFFRNFQKFRHFFASYSPFSSKISLKRVAMATIRSNGLRVFEVCMSNIHSSKGLMKSVWLICFTEALVYGLFTFSGITRRMKASKPSKSESRQ